MTDATTSGKAPALASGAMVVLFTLAAGQFLMTLDTSVMNVSIATVAKDVGTTVTGTVWLVLAGLLVVWLFFRWQARVESRGGEPLVRPEQNPDIPNRVESQAEVELAGGVPFVSDADLEAALDDAGVDRRVQDETLEAYADARIDGLRNALAILALLVVVALFFAQRIPRTQPGRAET